MFHVEHIYDFVFENVPCGTKNNPESIVYTMMKLYYIDINSILLHNILTIFTIFIVNGERVISIASPFELKARESAGRMEEYACF